MTIVLSNVTLPVLRLIRILKERLLAREQPETAPKLKDKDMVKTLNTIVDFFQLS